MPSLAKASGESTESHADDMLQRYCQANSRTQPNPESASNTFAEAAAKLLPDLDPLLNELAFHRGSRPTVGIYSPGQPLHQRAARGHSREILLQHPALGLYNKNKTSVLWPLDLCFHAAHGSLHSATDWEFSRRSTTTFGDGGGWGGSPPALNSNRANSCSHVSRPGAPAPASSPQPRLSGHRRRRMAVPTIL